MKCIRYHQILFMNLDLFCRVNTRWNAVLRSFPVVRYTRIIRLKAQSTDNKWWAHRHKEFAAAASADVINVVIKSVRHQWSHRLHDVSLNDYWPNLRTLCVCNGFITPLQYHKGKDIYNSVVQTLISWIKFTIPNHRSLGISRLKKPTVQLGGLIFSLLRQGSGLFFSHATNFFLRGVQEPYGKDASQQILLFITLPGLVPLSQTPFHQQAVILFH